MITVGAVAAFLEQFAPAELAAEWDNVGLLLGERSARVERILTCLTVTPEVVAEAIDSAAQMIVTHHPILFRGVKRLTGDSPEGRMALALARGGVAVFSPHTAFDNTSGGINEILARRLALTEVAPLRRAISASQYKIVVFVPDNDLQRVMDALFANGAGLIGNYSQCGFRLAGVGTFFGSEETNPTVGQKGRREEVNECRLEVVCPEENVEQAVAAMREAHSYEEPAYDVYPLRPVASPRGEGRLGRLERPTTLAELAQAVKAALRSGPVQLVGDPARSVQQIALVCGAGGEFLKDAVRARADVLLTGEVRFHDYLAAHAQQLALLLPGHYATERCGVEELAARLEHEFADVQVWASRRECDPVNWI